MSGGVPVNPKISDFQSMNIEDPQAYIDGVISRDRRMMSKTITLIESSLATHQKAARVYENALHFLRLASPIWIPPVLTCSSAENVGIREIWQTVLSHHQKFSETGELEQKRKQQALDWMWSLIEEGIRIRFNQNPEVKSRLRKISHAVEKGNTAPTVAAEELLFFLDKK